MSAREPLEGSRPGSRARTYRIAAVLAAVAVLAIAVAVVVPLTATSTPRFFSRYHLLERRYVNLENSAHEGIGCRACHETQPVTNGAALIGDYYVSFFRRDAVPRLFKFRPPRNEACLQCHEDDWSSQAARTGRIPHPAHARVADETRRCVGCHKWTAHFEPYMAKHKTMPFSGVCVAYGCHVGTKVTSQCFDCHHVLGQEGTVWRKEHPRTVKAKGQSGCLESCHEIDQCRECHTTGKTPKVSGLAIEVGMKSIEKLHVKPDWTAKYHGAEALKGEARCMKCHQSEGECDECHLQRPAFHGGVTAWIGRHAKQSDTVDDPKCLTCHEKPWCEKCHKQFKEMG